MYAIAGTTGQTGSAVAQRLLERGAPVRVIVRERSKADPWVKRGAEVAIASLDDADALTRALEGATGAYLLSAPGAQAQDFLGLADRTTSAIAAALERTGVRAVLLSSIGAQHASGTGPIRTLHDMEQKVGRREGVTHLRPAYFMENWAGVLSVAKSDGALPSVLPLSVPLEMVATRDIGYEAADLLLDRAAPTVVELAGPRPYTVEDVAAAAAAALGRSVQPIGIEPSQVAATMQGAGVGASLAQLYGEMIDGAMKGLLGFEGAPRRGRDTIDVTIANLAG